MSVNVIYITAEGYQELMNKLNRLKYTELPETQNAIKIARGFGDFSENAELDSAREKEDFLLSEIGRIESIIPRLRVPPYKDHTPYVRFGAYVTWKNNSNPSNVISYRIVGHEESNLANNTISLNAPIAQSSLAKKVGDTIIVNAPEGIQTWTITDVKY